MHIVLFGDNELVSSVSVERNAIGWELLVNTVERHMPFHRQGGSVEYRPDPSNYPHSLVHECVVISNPLDAESRCEVVIVADNDDDVKLLQRHMAYFSQDDEQVSAIYVANEYLASREPICTIDVVIKEDSLTSSECGL